MSARARFWPVATSVFGLATLALLFAFRFLPDVQAAYPGDSFTGAMSGFQRAVTPAQFDDIFGAPVVPGRVAALHAANTLDLYGFIPAYALFLISAAAMLAGGLKKPLAWLAVLPALVGAGADVLETLKQLRMTADIGSAKALLPVGYVWVKYFALGFAGLGMSAICFLGAHKRWIVGMLGFAPLAATFAEWSGALDLPSLTAFAVVVLWVPLLVLALLQVFKPAPT